MNKKVLPDEIQLSLGQSGGWATLPTPKIRGRTSEGVLSWAHAYAGFSYQFALESMRMLIDSGQEKFLDPFVGSGTSALAAARSDVAFIGIDLDPFSALLSRSLLAVNANEKQVRYYLKRDNRYSITSFSNKGREIFHDSDLKYAAGVFHKILKKFRLESTELWKKILNDPKGIYDSEVIALTAVTISSRGVAKVSRGSNPVWLKNSINNQDNNRHDLENITTQFSEKMFEDLVSSKRGPSTRIKNADFAVTRLEKNSIDRILTSPPYLNRLDYIISHLPEVAMLSGFIPIDIENLRCKMMGTTKMIASGEPPASWGSISIELLENIRRHPSKASSTYYYKFHYQYFNSLKSFFDKLSFVSRENARGLLVVQDSYYKEIRIPVVEIMQQMGKESGIEITEIRTEEVRGHIGSMSPTQKAYVKSKVLREHVLHLEF